MYMLFVPTLMSDIIYHLKLWIKYNWCIQVYIAILYLDTFCHAYFYLYFKYILIAVFVSVFEMHLKKVFNPCSFDNI